MKKQVVGAAIILGVIGMTTFSSGAVAGDRAGSAYAATAAPTDLRGNGEPVLVVFGQRVEFKHYLCVSMLSQFMAIATDVQGGVRYNLHETRDEKTLIID